MANGEEKRIPKAPSRVSKAVDKGYTRRERESQAGFSGSHSGLSHRALFPAGIWFPIVSAVSGPSQSNMPGEGVPCPHTQMMPTIT